MRQWRIWLGMPHQRVLGRRMPFVGTFIWSGCSVVLVVVPVVLVLCWCWWLVRVPLIFCLERTLLVAKM